MPTPSSAPHDDPAQPEGPAAVDAASLDAAVPDAASLDAASLDAAVPDAASLELASARLRAAYARNLARWRRLRVAAWAVSLGCIAIVVGSTIVAGRLHWVYVFFTLFSILTQLASLAAWRLWSVPPFLLADPDDVAESAAAARAFADEPDVYLRPLLVDLGGWDLLGGEGGQGSRGGAAASAPGADVTFEAVRAHVRKTVDPGERRRTARVVLVVWAVVLCGLLAVWFRLDLAVWLRGAGGA